jgi:drug/metabolite transporter (DMT)-like permease
MVGWGASWIPSALLVERWEPQASAAARLGLAGLLIIVFLAVTGRRVLPGVGLPALIWIGLTQTALFYGIVFWGIAEEGAGLSAVLSNTDPLFVAALGVVFLSERLRRVQWAGLILGFLGAVIVASPDGLLPLAPEAGALLITGAGLSWAVGTIVATRFLRGVTEPLALAGWQMLLGALMLAAFSATIEAPPTDFGPEAVSLLLFTAVLGSAVPLWLFYAAVRHAPVGELSAWFFLVPAIAVIAAWPVLGEDPTPSLVTGMILTGAGMLLVFRPRPAPA